MEYKDYKVVKHGKFSSVGTFGESILAFRHFGGSSNHSEYYLITKEEFERFPDNEQDLEMFRFSDGRKLCSDYIGDTEFDEKDFLQ